MVYARPINPHCLFSRKLIWMQYDWVLFLPRIVLDFLHSVYTDGIMNNANPAFASNGKETPEGYIWRLLTSPQAETFTQGIKVHGPTKGQAIDMTAGAMVLRPRGPGFPTNVCSMGIALDPHGQEGLAAGGLCLGLLQQNPYNTPFQNLLDVAQ